MPSPEPPQPAAAPAGGRSLWWTRRAFALHVTLAAVVPVFAALFWWQVQRVREGNTLSWAYVFEWPIFTGYAIYLWWRLVHDQGEEPLVGRPAAPGSVPLTEGGEGAENGRGEPDEELAAYNRYLAELHATGKHKRW